MKYVIKLIACLLITLNASCQVTQIVPLNSLRQDHSSNGVYFKDLNNELSFWEGTWEGTINNKKYTFVFIKFSQNLRSNNSTNYYYRDVLKGRYKVVDLATNQVLYDNLSATNYDDYSILGLAVRNGDFIFRFRDTDSKCNNSVQFHLQKSNSQPNQVKYCYFRFDSYYFPNCPNYPDQESIPMFLPRVDLTLAKL